MTAAAAPHNVLYVIRTWALGGSHTIMMSLMRRLPRDRFNVVCAAFDTPAKTDEVLVEALKAQGLPVLDERIPWFSRRDGPRARHAIVDLVRRYNIGLVHTHDDQSNVIVGLGRKEIPCACVASPYGWWRRLLPLRSHVYVFLERQVALPRFERVITVSEDMRKKILKGRTNPARIEVIHTGIDVAEFEGGVSRAEARHSLGLPDDAFVVGAVSRLYEEKGHAYLLRAIRQLRVEGRKVRGLIVGTGPLREPLEQSARDLGLGGVVVFTGFHADLPGALRAMDVLAQPSVLDEGLPTSILEAQAMGLPVIASDVGGVGEALEHGVTGLLVPKRDADALASAIRVLMDDPGSRTSMGMAARDRIRNEFRIETMIDRVSQTYDAAIADHRKRR